MEGAILPEKEEHPSLAQETYQKGDQPQPKSFREALVAGKKVIRFYNPDLDEANLHEEMEFLLSEEEEEERPDAINNEEGDSPFPKIKLTSRTIKRIRQPWNNCLIVKLLGKPVGYKMLITRVARLWSLQGDFEAIDLGFGFFLFKFDMVEDCVHVFSECPWIIMDQYLTVRRWKLDLPTSSAEVMITAMWIHFPGLPIEYYDEKVLLDNGEWNMANIVTPIPDDVKQMIKATPIARETSLMDSLVWMGAQC
ncbi:hypothetical protein F0562_023277 [Nyssa sinensis]|uniref:DUF4283 domain-containing protein n=1 Tax=Nyssa sinensis TaxID=561372 RepID=A0A5J5BGA1_9ASTE|nr:hypothetical protein F0562_023277 [Nyssa sinensis]